ncbi:hypothetical protein NDU88_005352 [Pleurodeles waltl]|uniref:Uncharacterized protein n=1 Tax=Pleurodeles waltl TaxID=8319 RepID=A0AAV7SLD0_PLEWA|nr:hypothetical protein NDU88_005352 [Pleurodeles waltl]
MGTGWVAMYYAVVVSSSGNTEDKAPPTCQEPELGVAVTVSSEAPEDKDLTVTLGLLVGRSAVGLAFQRLGIALCVVSIVPGQWAVSAHSMCRTRGSAVSPPLPHRLSLGVAGSHDTPAERVAEITLNAGPRKCHRGTSQSNSPTRSEHFRVSEEGLASRQIEMRADEKREGKREEDMTKGE